MARQRLRSILFGATGLTIGGGIAVVSRSIIRALAHVPAGQRPERVDRVLLLESPPGPPAPEPPARQMLCGGSQARFARAMWAGMLRTRPDLIIFDHIGLARAMLPNLPIPRSPFAIFVHGSELEKVSASRLAALRRASVLMANSEYTAAQIVRLVPDRRDAVRVVPLCIEPERLMAWKDRTSEAHGSQERRPAVLIVGRMWSSEPGKGHDALIEGWGNVRERVPDAELWIVGTGDDVDRLQRKAALGGHGATIRFMGGVSDAQLGQLYRSASVFAMPSRQEGFGLVYLEAMWHGLPCVASTADAASCVVDPASGVLVSYGDATATADAVAGLLEDPKRARAMGVEAQRRARTEFSFERFQESLLDALGIT